MYGWGEVWCNFPLTGAEHRAKLIDNVFKPFYRVDQSRNQNVSNSGLGLATTKSLLNSINGKISLHDSYLGGLEVAIEIPN